MTTFNSLDECNKRSNFSLKKVHILHQSQNIFKNKGYDDDVSYKNLYKYFVYKD